IFLKKVRFFMTQPRITKEWIEKANEDFGFAVTSIESNDYFPQICFHFQQAAEKYLKAFIIGNELEFRPIHNLVELLEICKCKESCMDKAREACLYLNPFYIDTR
ncbi:MAG: HEPN domain-containing protein, partial [Candidatus Anammoxibacter sp.]